MLELLIVLIVIFTAAGMHLAITASGDIFVRLSGMATTVLGVTVFGGIGKLLIRKPGATPPWLEPFFKPFADMPDCLIVAGLTAAGTMAVAAIVALVNEYTNPRPQQKGDGH